MVEDGSRVNAVRARLLFYQRDRLVAVRYQSEWNLIGCSWYLEVMVSKNGSEMMELRRECSKGEELIEL